MTITIWSSATRLPADPLSPSRARSFVSENLIDHDLRYLLEPCQLIVSELATNAIVHARSPFTVTLTGLYANVLLEVENAEDHRAAASNGSPTMPPVLAMATNGRGLNIVAALSQNWGVTSVHLGFKTVWASIPTMAA